MKRNNPTSKLGVFLSYSIIASIVLLGMASLNVATADGFRHGHQDDKLDESKLIESILSRQTAAWNKGNLDEFMSTYWKSENLTFSSGGKTTRGWQATLDRYKKKYQPGQMGTLRFDHLEVSLVSDTVALVLGNWYLRMENGTNPEGNFSLVCKKIDGNWKIIHDHSSALEKD